MKPPNNLPNDSAALVEEPKTVRLSYQELADRLGVPYDTARLRAKRLWRVEKGNDRRPVVIVPLAELRTEPSANASAPEANSSRARTEPEPNDSAVVRSLRSALSEAEEALAEARERAIAAETKLEVLEEERDRERKLLEATIADLRRRLDTEEAHRRRPWWQKLLGR
jgi:transcriptional regulator with XRE-family HTH domain